MPFIGNKPSAVPLTSADIADGIITSAKIVDGSIVNADINASSAIALSKLSATGTSNQVLRMNTGATALEFATVSGTTFGSALLHVRDEKSSGTHGGTSITSYTKRDLNTVMTNEISGASLASDVITLPSGTYYINARAFGYRVDRQKLKLRNTTDSSDTLIGGSMYTEGSQTNSNNIFLVGRFTISAQKNFEIQQKCETVSVNGLGIASGYGDTEVYTDVQIWKVA